MDELMSDQALMANANAKQGLDDMRLLFSLLPAFKVLGKVNILLFYKISSFVLKSG